MNKAQELLAISENTRARFKADAERQERETRRQAEKIYQDFLLEADKVARNLGGTTYCFTDIRHDFAAFKVISQIAEADGFRVSLEGSSLYVEWGS